MDALLRKLVRDESGQDFTEYAVLIALIALACIAAVGLLGSGLAIVLAGGCCR